jgi:hypothetical protein
MILAQDAAFADLDGSLLSKRDREPGLAVVGSVLQPPAEWWGVTPHLRW